MTLNGATGLDVGVGLGGLDTNAGADCAAGGENKSVISVGIAQRGDSGVGSERCGEVVGGDGGTGMVEACLSNNKSLSATVLGLVGADDGEKRV